MRAFFEMVKKCFSWFSDIVNSKLGKIVILLLYVLLLISVEYAEKNVLILKCLMVIITIILGILKSNKSDEKVIGTIIYIANALVLLISLVCGSEDFGIFILTNFAIFESISSIADLYS